METVVLLLLILSQVATSTDLTCHLCFDAVDPTQCNNTAVCGKQEICFIRQFRNNNGDNRYHMGCLNDKVCTLITTATAIGKRQADPVGCVDCCSSDACNSKLCLKSVTSSV